MPGLCSRCVFRLEKVNARDLAGSQPLDRGQIGGLGQPPAGFPPMNGGKWFVQTISQSSERQVFASHVLAEGHGTNFALREIHVKRNFPNRVWTTFALHVAFKA